MLPVDPPFDQGLHDLLGEREYQQVMGRIKRAWSPWVTTGMVPVVKLGEDQAGPWWEVTLKGGDALTCLAPIRAGQVGWRTTQTVGVCDKRAGWGTSHDGAGYCRWHEKLIDDKGAGGDGHRGRTGAWVMAHGFARALDVTPWQALLTAVKIAAGRVAYIEMKLGEAHSDEQLLPDGDLAWWVRQSEMWHDRMAKVAKMAIDAGVAERLVKQVELEAELMLKATTLTFAELGMDDMTRERALGIMSRHLLALESAEAVDALEVLD
jgi:hypothetical protein